ncbi:transcription factor 15-like isoform X1 [Syngnathus typhle]|uniref:transcription factor 15-like isoform X1 n=1 Tax=Syngnathus typhle TaxID=161592 RepID=UPI002A6B36D6|nr:transcription factor 15-like isoform X1 [Syngnathus typhle]
MHAAVVVPVHGKKGGGERARERAREKESQREREPESEREGAREPCSSHRAPASQPASQPPMMAFTMLRPMSAHSFAFSVDLSLTSDEDEENRSESEGSTDKGYGCCAAAAAPGSGTDTGIGGVVVVEQRNVANARERHRTQNVNTAFSALRTLIPTEPVDRKLSKIETLRLASSYISHLANVLQVVGDDEKNEDGRSCGGAPRGGGGGGGAPRGGRGGAPRGAPRGAPHGASPCLRASGDSGQPRSICTFCLSKQRKVKDSRHCVKMLGGPARKIHSR